MVGENYKPCSLLRRFAAVSYDALLLFSILFFATLIILPVTGGEAISGTNHYYHFYLWGCCYLYFAWQWIRGGQTLGMKAWRIRVISFDNTPLIWRQANLRFLLACVSWLILGVGFIWALFDRDNLAVHDRFSGTKLIRVARI